MAAVMPKIILRCSERRLSSCTQPIIVAHVEAVIAADHHAIGADHGDDELHVGLRVGDGVVGEGAQVGARGLRDVFRLLSPCPTMVDAPDQDWQDAAGVR